MTKESNLNYYQLLECDNAASIDEIKKNYQRLILTTHPDKLGSETEKFHLIQRAWTVLRDAEKRKQYDAELSCKEHSELLLYETILLSDMDYDAEDGVYTYNCRCGGTYLLKSSDCKMLKVVIGCDECSFSIAVNL